MVEMEPKYAAVLFADISGSTALYDELGDEQALLLVTRTLDVLKEETLAHHGQVIKTIGDEILCLFPDAITGFNAACAMQEAIEKRRPQSERAVHVRIGLHYGEVLQKGSDIYGDTVNVAARVVAITRARQIIVTHTVAQSLSDALHKKTRPVMRTVFRGKTKAYDLFHVLWENERAPERRAGDAAFRKPAESRQEIMLRYASRVLMLNEERPYAVLGRGENCDCIVTHPLASRQHARIEYHFGKPLLADSSKNGTFIRYSDGREIRIHQRQIVLHGAGHISLGQPFSKNPTEIIEFLVQ